MAGETFYIDIAENGDVRVEGEGIVGPECEALTKEIEEALGVVTQKTRKPEFNRRAPILRKNPA